MVGDGGHALHITHPAAVVAAIADAWALTAARSRRVGVSASRGARRDRPPASEAVRREPPTTFDSPPGRG